MPLLTHLPLSLTVDQVLLAEGADPQQARERSPRLVDTASQALELGQPLLQPVVAYRQWKVKAIQHERILLADGALRAGAQRTEPVALSGKAIARWLAPVKQVVVLVCTIGDALESFTTAMLPADPALGLALDAVGSAAVQALVEAACAHFGQEAVARGWEATLPFSPGMEGWQAGPGQAQVFTALDAPGLAEPPDPPLSAQAGVTLRSAGVMVPLKSITAVIGLGPEVDSTGRVCDYCSVRQTCRYQV